MALLMTAKGKMESVNNLFMGTEPGDGVFSISEGVANMNYRDTFDTF